MKQMGILFVSAAFMLSACAWVELTPGGKKVRILSEAEVASCKKLGSFWLMAFSLFFFLSVAMAKRYAELGQYSLDNKLVLSANAMIGNTSKSRIFVAGSSGFETSLGNSFTYRLGLSGDYAFAQNIHANLGVDYTRFKYGISALVQTANGVNVEPDSETRYMIIKIGLGYAF